MIEIADLIPYYNDDTVIDDTYTIDDTHNIDDNQSAEIFINYLLGIREEYYLSQDTDTFEILYNFRSNTTIIIERKNINLPINYQYISLSPLFKTGISHMSLNFDYISNFPIFKRPNSDKNIPIFISLPIWSKSIQVLNQWESKESDQSNWQSETKPNNIWEG